MALSEQWVLMIFIIRRAVGLSAIEVNASVTRNKSDNKRRNGINGKRSNSIKAMSSNWGLQSNECTREQILIMDEIDGMGGVNSHILSFTCAT